MQPPCKYMWQVLRLEDHFVILNFYVLPVRDKAWINGGFFVLEPSVIDFIDGDYAISGERTIS